MPRNYARSGYSKRKKSVLPYGIYQVAKSAARAAAAERKQEAIESAAKLLTGGQPIAYDNIGIRRKAAIMAGKGMYTGAGAYGIRQTLGSFAKRNKIGQRVFDATAGRLLGGGGMYTGMGEYTPDSNNLITKSSMDIVPMFAPETDEGILISRREYVAEIFGPDLVRDSAGVAATPNRCLPFVLQSYSINPGLESTFPWLSQLAQNYDEYELVQCIFTFKSTTTESSNSTNGQVGTIIMATNYNAAAQNFTDKASMQHYESSNSARLTESICHGVECDPEKRSGADGLYVRSNPVVTSQDLKTYDHGKFQIAVANAAVGYANVSLGELWVSYTVRLRKSKFFTSLGLGISKDIFVSKGNEATIGAFMGNNMLKGQQNNLGVLLQNIGGSLGNSGLSFTFPATYNGHLKILITIEGTLLTRSNALSALFTPSGNVVFVRDLYGTSSDGVATSDQPSYVTDCSGASSYIALVHIDVDIATNGVNNTLFFQPGFASGSTISQCYVDISEYNSGFSGKAQNINLSDAPLFVDASGVITPP